jgi:hypothetical protein
MKTRSLAVVALALAPLVCYAGESRAGQNVDYLRQIKPLVAEKCLACHGALKQKGTLRLDTAALARKGGKHGPAIVPGDPENSLLVERITAEEGSRMPPEGEPLTAGQIALLREWIRRGATTPAHEEPEKDPRDHWAFRCPVRPPVPRVQNQTWVRNPIDAFIAWQHEQRQLIPQTEAPRELLIRRLYLDLIGMPPSLEEMSRLDRDRGESWYECLVDRLLADPRYGERWGRHWMDVWRYSDHWGLGQEVRNSQKHIWHWRDWIVESLNADKGYDQMVREMLAADELYPTDLDRLRASGYLARHYFRFNRTTWLDETVEHTAKAFLGLTLNCCKCHDHKYDPLPQADFYRFRAFFEPYQVRMEQVPGEADYEKDGIPRAFDCNLDAPTYLFIRGDDRNPAKDKRLEPALPALLTWAELEIRPVNLPPEAHSPGLRPFVLENYLRAAEKKFQAAQEVWEQAGKATNPELVPALEALAEKMQEAAEAETAALKARAAADRSGSRALAREAALAERRAGVIKAEEDLARADLDWLRADEGKKAAADDKRKAARAALLNAWQALLKPGETHTALQGALKTPESNVETEASRNRPSPRTSTGRRSALADWITDRRNPLTARVAVNHLWNRHFGRPLVETVFDFGRKGTPPLHPALLDYLALELMEHDWSMKHLHRLIVTSSVYRLSSSSAGADPKTRYADPESRYYWRRGPLRMEAQVLRDSLLSLAGELDMRLGGPPVPVSDEGSKRRSLYFVHSHNDQQKFLGTFDDASVRECYRRSESIVPQQALALANSRLSLATAGRISDQLHRQLGEVSDRDFARAAFAAILAGSPAPEEQTACEEALREWREQAKGRPDAGRRARTNLVHALVNHNDFITIR